LKVKNVRSVRKGALAQVPMLQATTFSFSFLQCSNSGFCKSSGSSSKH